MNCLLQDENIYESGIYDKDIYVALDPPHNRVFNLNILSYEISLGQLRGLFIL